MNKNRLLRFFTFIVAIIAAILMVLDEETFFNVSFPTRIKYSDFLAFRYQMATSFISAAYSLGSAVLRPDSLLYKLFLPLDATMALLLISSNSAAATTIIFERQGTFNDRLLNVNGYTCDRAHKFCVWATVSVCFGFLAFFLFIGIFYKCLDDAVDYRLRKVPKPPPREAGK